MTWHPFHLTTFHRTLREWRARARSRREIATLDVHAIRDLGLCPSQMQFEAGKPFWRA